MTGDISTHLAVIALLLCAAQAAYSHPEDLGHCIGIEIADDRLTCFDMAAGTLPDSGVVMQDPSQTQQPRFGESNNDASVTDIQQGDENASEDPGLTRSDSGSTLSDGQVADQATESEIDQFGEIRKSKQVAESTRIQQIFSRIISIRKAPLGNRIMELENGQIWMANEPGRRRVENNQSVAIRRGAFRSYEMILDDGGRIRVHRVK